MCKAALQSALGGAVLCMQDWYSLMTDLRIGGGVRLDYTLYCIVLYSLLSTVLYCTLYSLVYSVLFMLYSLLCTLYCVISNMYCTLY